MLRWLKTVVVNDEVKGVLEASGGDREGERERIADDVSKLRDDIETGVSMRSRDEPGGCPPIGQAVSGMRRREPGLRVPCGTGEGMTGNRSRPSGFGERERPGPSQAVRD